MHPLLENPGLMGLVGGIAVTMLPRIFAYMTRGRAAARAATLKEIAEHTAVMERQMARIEADNITLRKINQECMEHNRLMDHYVDELERALRMNNIVPPTPPWMHRLKGPRDG